MDKETLLAELKVREENLTNEMNVFFKKVQFSKEFIDLDKLYVNGYIDFYYEKTLRTLTKQSDLEKELLLFNNNMNERMKNRVVGNTKSELNEYLVLIMELYNIEIKKEYLKLN